jgi:hypothetical protein
MPRTAATSSLDSTTLAARVAEGLSPLSSRALRRLKAPGSGLRNTSIYSPRSQVLIKKINFANGDEQPVSWPTVEPTNSSGPVWLFFYTSIR